MDNRPVVKAAITISAATISWALVTYLLGGRVEWRSLVIFAAVFGVLFNLMTAIWSKWCRLRKG